MESIKKIVSEILEKFISEDKEVKMEIRKLKEGIYEIKLEEIV